MINIEFIGYLGSLFVGISLLMTNMQRLRYINLCGCIMFVIYGVLINAIPVVFMNAFCTMINLYHILKVITQQKRELTD